MPHQFLFDRSAVVFLTFKTKLLQIEQQPFCCSIESKKKAFFADLLNMYLVLELHN